MSRRVLWRSLVFALGFLLIACLTGCEEKPVGYEHKPPPAGGPKPGGPRGDGARPPGEVESGATR